MRTNLLDFLVLRCCLEHCRHIFGETQDFERLGDVVTCNCLLGLFIRYLICLRRDESDELYAAFYQKIPGLFGVGNAVALGQNLANDFLDRR